MASLVYSTSSVQSRATRVVPPCTARHARATATSRPPTQTTPRTIAKFLATLHVAASLQLPLLATLPFIAATPGPAQAVLNSPNAKIARSPNAAIRRSIPALNSNVKEAQAKLEQVFYILRIPGKKNWGAMNGLAKSCDAIVAQTDKFIAGVKPEDVAVATQISKDIREQLAYTQSQLSLKDPDLTSVGVANSLELISNLEVLQIPGLPFNLPTQYATLPQLQGLAKIALTLEGPEGYGGVVELTLNGYAAPVSAGRFVKNVLAGMYNGVKLVSDDQSVYVEAKGGGGQGDIPLEIQVIGEFEPQYGTPIDVQNKELPALPLSINGAVTMARSRDGGPGMLSGEDWFLFRYDRSSSGLSGMVFDEGTFGVFGYVTDNVDLFNDVDNDFKLVKAEVLSGKDKLVVPS